MERKFYHSVVPIVFCLFFVFTGCGGGGGSGGGDGGGGGGGLRYTGETAPAEVDENNATDIAAGAFAAGQIGSVMTASEASPDDQAATDLQIDSLRTVMVPRVLGDAARSMDLSTPLYQLSFNAEATRTVKDSEDGPCGGSVSYTLDINDNTGEFDGIFTFSNYCAYGVTISGNADVEGTADLGTGDIITITFWFDNLTDGTMTMDGEMSMDFSGSPILCTLDALFKDETTGKVYWAKDYLIEIYEYPGYIEVDISGTFYHPDYGYVDVTTEELFVIHDEDEWPSSGILLMVGANNTGARLTAINNLRCRVEADTDGDGEFDDWDSGPLLWSDYDPFEEIIIDYSYVQYRTYSDAANNRYGGYVRFLKDGQEIEASDIANIALLDPNQNEMDITVGDFWSTEYYYGAWNEVNQQVYYSGPNIDAGFGIYFPPATDLAGGNYTYEATTSRGVTVSQTHYFPGKLELEFVDSAAMVSEWINGDLKLSWTIPDPVGPFDQVRVRLQSGDQIYLVLRLPNTATEVTIPEQWINNVKQLSNSDTMDWYVLFYAYDITTNNQYARSHSALKPIAGWSN